MDNTRNSPDNSRRHSALLSQLPALQTGLTVTINTRDAAVFWENNRLNWRLAALSRIWQAQKNGNPWADERLWQLDQAMLAARTLIASSLETFNEQLALLPPGVAVAVPDFTQGVSLGQQSACPPVGYFITLFALFNQALLTLLQVRMTGLQEVTITDEWRRALYQAMRAPLRLLLPGPALSAAHSSVTRADLLQGTPLARQWLLRTTIPSVDVLTGDARSRWQSALSLAPQLADAIRTMPRTIADSPAAKVTDSHEDTAAAEDAPDALEPSVTGQDSDISADGDGDGDGDGGEE